MEIEQLQMLMKTMSELNLTEVRYEEKGVKLCLKKDEKPTVMTAPAENPGMPGAAAVTSPEEGILVKSPLVGVFYAAPSEDAEPFVTAGDTVKEGQTLGIVEAMKLMNDIECECSGTVAEIYVRNGQTVEYGQPLFRVVPQE